LENIDMTAKNKNGKMRAEAAWVATDAARQAVEQALQVNRQATEQGLQLSRQAYQAWTASIQQTWQFIFNVQNAVLSASHAFLETAANSKLATSQQAIDGVRQAQAATMQGFQATADRVESLAERITPR
jgi:hypothetical protein